MQKKNRVTLNDFYSNSNTTFSNLIYKLEEETMLNELKQLIKASGRHTNVQKNKANEKINNWRKGNAKNLEQIHWRINSRILSSSSLLLLLLLLWIVIIMLIISPAVKWSTWLYAALQQYVYLVIATTRKSKRQRQHTSRFLFHVLLILSLAICTSVCTYIYIIWMNMNRTAKP